MKTRYVLIAALVLVLAAVPAAARPLGNASLQFDGVNDYVTVADPINLSGAMTLEAWVLLDTADKAGRILSNRQGADGYELDIHNEIPGGAVLGLGGNGNSMGSTSFEGHQGTWTHVAVSWNPETHNVIFYLNGEVADTVQVFFDILATSGPMVFGDMGTRSGIFVFDGSLDEIRIWSDELSQTTIQAWMDRTVTPAHPDYDHLEGYWPFDEGSGQSAAGAVHSPARDGLLGGSSAAEATDPTWRTDGAPMPVERTSFGRIKARGSRF